MWSCLIRCANMKWIRWVLLKIQSGHHSVHRRTDGQGDTSIPPFQLRWSEGYDEIWIGILSFSFEKMHLKLSSAKIAAHLSQSLATNSPAPWPAASPASASGTRSYGTTSRDQRGKIEMFFSSTGACTAAKFPIANHHSQMNTQLYSASLIRHIWQQCHSNSEFDAI